MLFSQWNIRYSQSGICQLKLWEAWLLSDFSNGFGGFDQPEYKPVAVKPSKGKISSGYLKPPYYLLAIGFALVPVSAVLLTFAPPTGSNSIFAGVMFWILSLASYFVPFAAFTLSDLGKQAKLNYLPNDKKSHRLRLLLLTFGSFFLLFPTFYLASCVASWVSVILG